MISLEEAKNYLKVDSGYDDSLFNALIIASEVLCCDIARLSDSDWEEICSDDASRRRELIRAAVLYTLGYLYEHREEADHHDLVMTLRNILFSFREGIL